MLLRIAYSNTKRFFKRTIESAKSYFPGGYQRLPKTPPCNPFSCTASRSGGAHTNILISHSYTESQNTNHAIAATTRKRTRNLKLEKDSSLIVNGYGVETKKLQKKKMNHGCDEIEDQEEPPKCLVTRKLKELEMMNKNNVDLVHDIEEVLHYYSRLTCPVYRAIIEKFFVEMYAGIFSSSSVNNLV